MVHVAQRLDAGLAEAARSEPTYLDFLDQVLRDELHSKHRKRIHMGIQIALSSGQDARRVRLEVPAER